MKELGQNPENVPISGVLPGDLQTYCFLRKLSATKNKSEPRSEAVEEEFLTELRRKLQSVSVEALTCVEGRSTR